MRAPRTKRRAQQPCVQYCRTVSFHRVIIAQLCLLGAAFAAPPALSVSLVSQTRAAADVLVARPPLDSKAAIHTIETAMTRIQRGLDAYFHAPNLLEARTDALAMRAVFRGLRQGDRPLIALVDDVLRFHPDLHDRIARACETFADQGCALRHRLLALASGPPTTVRFEAARRLLPLEERAIFDQRAVFDKHALTAPKVVPVSAKSAAPASRRE